MASIRDKTIKLLEENIRIILYDLKYVHGFLELTLKSQATREKKIN